MYNTNCQRGIAKVLPLRDTFTVKVGEKVDQVKVLQEKGSGGAYSLGGIRIEDGSAVGRSVDRCVRELWMAHIRKTCTIAGD